MKKELFESFVKTINAHDVEELATLMSEDHRFIDAQGNEVIGKEKMKVGWAVYFQLFPDYRIEVTEMFGESNTITAFGFASGSLKGVGQNVRENSWRLPAAWKAIIDNDKVRLWQVYADTKIPYDILNKGK